MAKQVARKPTTCWQLSSGQRTRIRDEWLAEDYIEVLPRSAHFAPSSPPFPVGEVEYINPAIETLFSILGSVWTKDRERCPHLTLSLHAPRYVVPGAKHISSPNDHMTMDLPNLIEKWRMDYTTYLWSRPVDVIWEAWTELPETEELKKAGWEVLGKEWIGFLC